MMEVLSRIDRSIKKMRPEVKFFWASWVKRPHVKCNQLDLYRGHVLSPKNISMHRVEEDLGRKFVTMEDLVTKNSIVVVHGVEE
jgi:hypothetical protein